MSKKKITELTAEQAAKMQGWADMWVANGLSTEPADWETAEEGIREAYKVVGLTPPSVFFRVSSPLAGAIASGVVPGCQVNDQVNDQIDAQLSDQVRTQVIDQVRTQVADQVSDQVSGKVRAQVRDQVHGQVHGQVSDQVGDQIDAQVAAQVHAQVSGQVDDQVIDQAYAQVRDQVYAQVSAQVRDQVHGQVSDQVYGQVSDQVYDQVHAQVAAQVHAQVIDQVKDRWWKYIGGNLWPWLASYGSFFDQVVGVPIPAVRPYVKIGQSAGWWWPCRGYAIISDRPHRLLRDLEGRLHSETGNAIEWRDGWGFACWHGVRVPREWIDSPETVDPRLLLEHENIEQRTALGQIIGLDKLLDLVEHEVISEEPDPTTDGQITLVRAIIDEETRHFAKVRGPGVFGPDGEYVLETDPEISTAVAAIANTYGVPEEVYRMSARRV